MTFPYISGETLDDLMHSVVEAINEKGHHIVPKQGACTEVTGVLLELADPLARVSRTETRGKLFSGLGELCWYLAGDDSLDFIRYYAPNYDTSAIDGRIPGSYGPRLFAWKGLNQFAQITDLLRKRWVSRQAVIQIFDACDLTNEHGSPPCTCTLQFMVRENKLDLFTYMRSNDVYWGLPHDIFAFTMLQEIMARDLEVELGTYKHAVGSLHIYDRNRQHFQQYLDEGYQSTKNPMPPMPQGHPWPAINSLLRAEALLRTGQKIDQSEFDGLDPYWLDFIRLLEIYRYRHDPEAIARISAAIVSPIYHTYIEKKRADALP